MAEHVPFVHYPEDLDDIEFVEIDDDDDDDDDDEFIEKEDHDNHGANCPQHSHWRDDAQFVFEDNGGTVPDNAPRAMDMLSVLSDGIGKQNPIIFRFALVWVNEKGHIQVATPGGHSAGETINLLTRAASILAFQDDQLEKEAKHVVAGKFKDALRAAIEHGEDMPDLAHVFGHSGKTMPVDEPTEPHTNKMDGGYL